MTDQPPAGMPRNPGGTTGARVVVALGLLSMFGPLSLDLYLPSLPELADDLDTTTSLAQLTITASLVGLALGQLGAGPLSDRYGRRRPLLVGLVAYLLASIACAMAPTIEALIALRLVQGLAGAAGIVIARAVARDLHSGVALLRFLSRLALVSGMAPIVAPLLGGQLARFTSWRGIFWVLAGFGVVLLVAGYFGVPETLTPARRMTGGPGTVLRSFGGLLRNRHFVGVGLAAGLAGASMFAYIAGSTFVLQEIYGLSPQGFSLVFGVNSVGIVLSSQLAGRLAIRASAVQILAGGLVLNLAGALGLVVSIVAGLGLWAVVTALFVMVSCLGLVFPTSTALALADHPDRAGSASSLLGTFQFLLGGLVAPLVGIAGEQTALPLGIVAVAVSGSAMLAFLTLVLRRPHRTAG